MKKWKIYYIIGAIILILILGLIFNIFSFIIGLCFFFIPLILIIKSIYSLIKSKSINKNSLLLCGATTIISFTLVLFTNLPKIPLLILFFVGFISVIISFILNNK